MKTRLAVVRGFRCTLSPSALSKRCSRRMRLAKSKRSRAVVPLVHAASGMAPPCARCERARLAFPDRTRTPARCRRYNAPCAAQWPGSIPAASTKFPQHRRVLAATCPTPRGMHPRPNQAKPRRTLILSPDGTGTSGSSHEAGHPKNEHPSPRGLPRCSLPPASPGCRRAAPNQGTSIGRSGRAQDRLGQVPIPSRPRPGRLVSRMENALKHNQP